MCKRHLDNILTFFSFRLKHQRCGADMKVMPRFWIVVLLLTFLSGCGKTCGRMEQPEDPLGRYRYQIEAAKRLLGQKEDWAERAEWEVLKSESGWEVIAWRVEYPERKGSDRYLPWGYSVIELDSRMGTVSYRRKG
jgi:hypothetical protein